MAKIFDILNDINFGKKNLLRSDEDFSDKDFSPFLILTGLSHFYDCIIQANDMNMRYDMPAVMMYDFLNKTIKKRKRFSKWDKASSSVYIDMLKEKYDYSNQKAKSVLHLFSKTELKQLKKEWESRHGGKR